MTRPIDNKPMGLADIKGELLLHSGEKLNFLWLTHVAFSNGVPSYELASDRDFLIKAGKQTFPDIIFFEDSK